MIAFRTFEQAPPGEVPIGIPLDYPWTMRVCNEEQSIALAKEGWIVVSQEQYDAHVLSLEERYSAWEATRQAIAIEAAIAQAMAFGQSILIGFRAENVAMGVIQDNMTGWLLNKLSPVMDAILTGSLAESITRLKAIPVAEYDGKYMTVPRMIQFINKIETYLGVPLTTELV